MRAGGRTTRKARQEYSRCGQTGPHEKAQCQASADKMGAAFGYSKRHLTRRHPNEKDPSAVESFPRTDRARDAHSPRPHRDRRADREWVERVETVLPREAIDSHPGKRSPGAARAAQRWMGSRDRQDGAATVSMAMGTAWIGRLMPISRTVTVRLGASLLYLLRWFAWKIGARLEERPWAACAISVHPTRRPHGRLAAGAECAGDAGFRLRLPLIFSRVYQAPS